MGRSGMSRRAVLLSGTALLLAGPARAATKKGPNLKPVVKPILGVRLRIERVVKRIDAQMAEFKASRDPRVRRFREQLFKYAELDHLEKIRRVNTLVNNSVTYRDDWRVWKQSDRWSTLLETLTKGGDCEDFAITKLVSLSLIGFPGDRMGLVVGRLKLKGGKEIGHAVAAARAPGDDTFWIMDNLSRDIWQPPSKHFTPIYWANRKATGKFE